MAQLKLVFKPSVGEPLAVELKVVSIVEYAFTASLPHYTGLSTVYSKISANNTHWQSWQGGPTVVDGVEVYQYTATNGILTLIVVMAQSSVHAFHLPLDANSLKVRYEINNYTYASGASPSRLAVITQLNGPSPNPVVAGPQVLNTTAFTFTEDHPSGVFAWSPFADTSKDSLTVVASTDFPTLPFVPVIFSFITPQSDVHPTTILWKNHFGLNYPTFCIGVICDEVAVGVLVASAFTLLVLVALSVIIFRRKRVGYQSL
eukprot:TRINITY_DN4202_c0_g1_i1.p1 TRINITY_DN4202_c0_g1~~TRINITY_DN4202_c0_g1_i1.p1  ORF type:complete len:260 (-),score=33.22 TRINITY_DN4202_c0_g1_i1:45-824(-)